MTITDARPAGFSHAELAAAIERFADAHGAELTPDQLFTLGEAAGIVDRVRHGDRP